CSCSRSPRSPTSSLTATMRWRKERSRRTPTRPALWPTSWTTSCGERVPLEGAVYGRPPHLFIENPTCIWLRAHRLDVVDRSDAQLLESAAAGDAQSYAHFFRRHVDAITRYAIRRCNGPEDVADLVGECFLVALQAAGRYRPETDTALP